MSMTFSGKVALVTGGAAGIGEATAHAFAAQGARVVVSDIDEAGGQAVVDGIRAAGGEAVFVRCNVVSADEVKALMESVIGHYGRLDCAFNNAGILGEMGKTADCTEENYDRLMAVNLKGVWLCMKYEIRQMLEQGAGVIVNAASNAGMTGQRELPVYGAPKAGIVQLTRTAALEYVREGIRINCINPGLIWTPFVQRQTADNPGAVEKFTEEQPIGRLGRPEEIGEAVVWLCSDAASFVTGHAMNVDGGVLA